MQVRRTRGIALILSVLVMAAARPDAAAVADYTLGGVGCGAAPLNFDAYCFGSFAFQGFQTAVSNPANFGPSGTVSVSVATTALNTFSDTDLTGINGLLVPWWNDLDAPAADVARIRTFFLNGGDLFILADDPGHDPVNDALGVPTVSALGVGERTISGGAPLFSGPFGAPGSATQYFAVGELDPADVIMRGGRVVGTDEDGRVTAAAWDENDYVSGAGRLVIATDVDTLVGFTTTYDPLNDNGRFALNSVAFLVNGGSIDALAYDLVGVPSCSITPDGFGAYCGIDGVFGPLRREAAKAQNFGPGGIVAQRVAFVEFDAFTPQLAATLKVVAIPWIQQLRFDGTPADNSSGYRAAVIDWFLHGGNLWLLQDDSFHDPIGEALGIPTPFNNVGSRATNGVAPTYDGPFGIATGVVQNGSIGGLEPADVTNNGGTVTGTFDPGTGNPATAVVATWRENQYAQGAGRMVIATDVDMTSLFSLPDANRIWSLNSLAFLVTSDSNAPTLDCDVNQRRLWPPSGKTASVTVSGVAHDDGSLGGASFTVTDEYGLAIPGGTLSIDPEGHFSFNVPLVASRNGGDLDGRLYTIDITASDAAGNLGTCSTTVTVPHDKGTS